MAHLRKHPTTGKWQVRWRDSSGREHSQTFARHSDARRQAAQVQVEIADGRWVDPRRGRIPLAEWVADLSAKTNTRPTTRARDEWLLGLVLDQFGGTAIGSITRTQVQHWVNELAERYAADTVKKSYQAVGRIMRAAVEDLVIPRSPCRDIELPRAGKRKPMRLLTHEEVHALAGAIEPRFRALVLLLAYTGLRFGEALALRRRHLALPFKRLTVVDGLTEVRGRLSFGEVKTKAARRTVAIGATLSRELERHIGQYCESGDDALIFTGEHSTPVREGNFRKRRFYPAVESSVGSPCTPHDLRHTHAAWLIAEGKHAKVIQERLGHSSIKITLDLYGHLMPGLDEEAAAALDAVWQTATGGGEASNTAGG